MENFEPRNFEPRKERVKEKNLYIVHLDMPRIIILSSVVIGIVAASFLFGMNFFNKGESSAKNLVVNEREIAKNMDEGEDLFGDLKDDELDGVKSDDLTAEGTEELSGLNKNGESLDLDGTKDLKSSEKTLAKAEDKADVLTKDNIREIISPAAKNKNSVVKKNKQAKKTVVATKVGKKKSPKTKAVRGNGNKSNRVKKSRVAPASKRVVSRHSSRGGFAVQVASYDRLPKAKSEVSRLQSRNYDAYVDRSIVNGKTYYRVKIGPVQTKNMANSLLNGVRVDSRYSGSYITRD